LSYELLVQRYKQRIFEFIYFQIKQHKHDAEDLTQEVFVELYKKHDSFRHESKFSSFLFSMAKNKMFNHFRSQSRRISFMGLFQKEKAPEEQSIDNEYLSDKELLKTFELLNKLKVEERQIIYLCDREGFSYLQISEILNVNIGTVRSRLNTARAKMAKLLRENEHGL
jgi:RNA polymerase sigma-70 factor (ECF subfamily)